MLQRLIEYIVHSLVENQSAVRVVEQEKEGARVIAISVDKSDIGRVIGRDGQTIKAIRSLAFSLMPESEIADIIINET